VILLNKDEEILIKWISENNDRGAITVKDLSFELNIPASRLEKLLQEISYHQHYCPFIKLLDKIVIIQEKFKEGGNN